ncbi:MAG: S-layer homology domain-containing protein [Armatimonadota bacterium]|nr:S-layer homology domain-containing protein [Armatimonadota bacterium]
MNKKLAILAGAGLGLGLILGTPHVSLAQNGAASGPFADVPADHWAYSAVDTLQKAGIVIGYPDGTYSGKRAMTRYEFAVAIARLLPLIKSPDLTGYAKTSDLDALRDDINSKLAANSSAIDALRALVNEFQPELQRLGQDVAAIKSRLDADEQRLAAVEEEQRRIKITGALDLIARADRDSRTNVPFVDANGTQSGVNGSNRILQQSDVYHNFALNIRGKLTDTATAVVKVEFGNFLPAVGNTSAIGYTAGSSISGYTGRSVLPGTLTGADSLQTHLREAYVDTPLSLGPLGGTQIQVGRIPVQFSKYTLQQPDADVYTNLYETDSGNYIVDGGKIAFKVGPVALQGFAGKNDTIPFAQPYGGAGIGFSGFGQTRPTGQILENNAAGYTQSTGARATIGSPNSIQLSGTLVHAGLTDATIGGAPTDPDNGRTYNKQTVYGADVNGALPFLRNLALGVDASYNVSKNGGTRVNTGSSFRYQSHEEQLSAQFGGLNVKGGYQYVGPYYSAPGYWGKLGAWTNPTNVRGPIVAAKYALTPKLTLKANAQFYKAAYGTTSGGFAIDSPLQQDDHVTRYQVGVGYGLTSSNAVDLGYEHVQYDLRNKNNTLLNSGKPEESYLTFGIGHSFNENASLKLLYQVVKYNDRATGFDPIDHDGNVAVGQFQIKF